MKKLPPRPPSHHIWPFSAFQTCKVHDVQPPSKAISKTAQSSSGPGNPNCNSRGSQVGSCSGIIFRRQGVACLQ
ncbi:hypothetical protein T06_6685 [Trichinella sp. T6]|nr:hypothetical protein T06_6685 [Trichinella sp. T6]